jgi:hypothetical protein
MARGDDLADGARAHDLADPDRLRIIGDRAHPAAHGRIDGEIAIAHQDLPGLKLRHRRAHDLEMRGFGNGAGPRLEPHLAIDLGRHPILLPF